MRRKHLKAWRTGIWTAVSLLLLAARPAAASDGQDMCFQEKKSFCADAKTPRAMNRCLHKFESRLSPACRDQRKAEFEARKRGGASTPRIVACQQDIKKLCKGVNPRANGIDKCLEENASKLSQECQAALKAK
jgi:hypothetical protein